MYIPPEVVIENAYVIEIPESKLEEIVNFERRVFGNRPNYDDHYYDLFHNILEKQEFESTNYVIGVMGTEIDHKDLPDL